MDEIKKDIFSYIKERGWDVLENPSNISKSISIEAAELLELFQWKNYSVSEIKADKELFEKVKKELADILIYSIEMALSLGIDEQVIIQEKLEHNKKKYPVEAVKGNTDEYYKIKQAYRNK
jgi:dCTP diphosphatase